MNFVHQRQIIFLLKRYFVSKMINETKKEHLQITANQFRQRRVTPAKVIAIQDLSKTVKQLTLAVENKDFNFKAGQWVDFFIPDVDIVAGYSICSSPLQLKQEAILNLAVKHSRHPPSHWVHTKCVVGSDVKVRVGGDFCYDPDHNPVDILMIAGGVGINPLFSIMLHVSDLLTLYKNGSLDQPPGKTHLLYSAKTSQELLFKNCLHHLSLKHPEITYKHFVTQESEKNLKDLTITDGRLTSAAISEALTSLDRNNLLCFICGPSLMISSVEKMILKENISRSQIKYEKWW